MVDAGFVAYNLAVAKELVSAGPFYEGSTVSFQITPSNAGPAAALAGWSVTDSILAVNLAPKVQGLTVAYEYTDAGLELTEV